MLRKPLDAAVNLFSTTLAASPLIGAIAGGAMAQNLIGFGLGLFAGPAVIAGVTVALAPVWFMRNRLREQEDAKVSGAPQPSKQPFTWRAGLASTIHTFARPATAAMAALDWTVSFASLGLVHTRYADKLADALSAEKEAGKRLVTAPGDFPSVGFTTLDLSPSFTANATRREPSRTTATAPRHGAAPAP